MWRRKCRKQQINSQTSELEALEARIREMERRLKVQANADNPADDSRAHTHDSALQPAEKDRPMTDQSREQEHQQQQQKYSGSRPGTARQSQQAVPGALPPTPAGSEGECDAPVPVARPPPRIVPRWPAAQTQGQPRPRGVKPSNACKPQRPSPFSLASASRGDGITMPEPLGDDLDYAQSMSESATFADYVIVPEPDGDRERDA